ncbi:MAG: FAD-dependent oxidoreductase, partial [Gammaproteobacteria bacterium]
VIERIKRSNVEVLSRACVWSGHRDEQEALEIGVVHDGACVTFRPRRLVLATGAYERSLPFPGCTLPGVLTTGAAQGLSRAYRVAPGRRVLIAGNGPLNLQVACELSAGGVEVVAVAELAPSPWPRRWRSALGASIQSPKLMLRGLAYLNALRRRGIPVLYNQVVIRAHGEDRLQRATIAAIDRRGYPRPGAEQTFEVDALCLGYGFLPSNVLARTLGCEHESTAPGVLVPIRDGNGRTTLPEIYIVGDGGVLGGAQVALAEGRIAARSVLRDLDHGVGVSAEDGRWLRRHRRFQRALRKLFEAPAPGVNLANEDTPICRCEAVPRGVIEAVMDEGVHDLGSLKRLTRAGMGRCQGRYCTVLLAELLAARNAAPRDPRALFMPQNPSVPVPAGMLSMEQPEWRGYRAAPLPRPAPARGPAHAFADTDVLVVGAGVIGTSAAYFLAKAGFDVCIAERGEVNGQASGGNAGTLHLQLLSFDFSGASESRNAPAVRTLALQRDGIALWQSIESTLDADFELSITGGVMVAENPRDLEFLRLKTESERSQGVEARLLSRSELRELVPAVSSAMAGGAICPGEGKINPLAATTILLNAAQAAGARLHPRTLVEAIEREARGFKVRTSRGIVRCRKIVNAAGAWSPDVAGLVGIELPVRSAPQQMIVTEAAEPVVDCVLAHARRHLTMKQARRGQLIIGGGWFADFDLSRERPVTLSQSVRGNLWAACSVVPRIGALNVLRTWAAVGVSIDGAPLIGEAPGQPGIVHAVGANGYTLGPILGRTVAEQITTGRMAPGMAYFSFERF